MSDDLVQRLRALSRHEHSDLSIGDEAADAIERKGAEIAELRKVNDSLARWKGEIDQRRILLNLPFPDDYDNSPRYAIETMIKAELAAVQARAERAEGRIAEAPTVCANTDNIVEIAHSLGYYDGTRVALVVVNE